MDGRHAGPHRRRLLQDVVPVLLMGASVCLLAAPSPAQCEVQQVYAPLAGAGDSFGQSLDLDGDELVVGSRYSATVFVRQDPGTPLDETDDDWVVQANLLGEHIWDKFGLAVSIDADHLLIGAPDYSLSFATMGAAYVFVRDDSGTPHDLSDDTWTEQVKLTGPTTDTISVFGSCVSLDGDRLAVGDPWGHLATGAPKNGFVHVARREDGGTPADPRDDQWITEALLQSGDGGVFFGSGVDLCGSELLVVGRSAASLSQIFRYRLDDAGTPRDRSDDVWVEQGLILPPPGQEAGFGRAVDRDGDHLLVGGNEIAFAYRLDDAGTPTDPLDDVWVQEGVLKASDDTQYDDAFGSAVSLHADRALVGARQHADVLASTGAAYLFQRLETAADTTSRWTEIVELSPAPDISAKNFGAAVLLDAGVAIVGESGFFQFVGPADSIYGKARVYAMLDGSWTYIDASLPGAGGVSPCLLGAGSLEPGSMAALAIDDASPGELAALVLGTSMANVPLKGGVLVPMPQHITWITMSATGHAFLAGRWPSNLPAGFLLFVQAWIIDDGGPAGFVATNAVRAETP